MMSKPLSMIKSLETEAHIWIAFIEKRYDRRRFEWCKTILSEDEQKKYESFYFEDHRNQYLVSHALLRTSLSNYVNIPPENWIFSYNSYGRPQISKPQRAPELRFNLSRTRGITVCLISSAIEAGIDIESKKSLNDPKLLYKHVLSPSEISSLQRVSAQTLKKRFLIYWTLKEAYIKAIGTGLSFPLTKISFKLNPHGCAHISFDTNQKDNPLEWQFAYFSPTPEHILALALRKKKRDDLKIKMFEVIP